MFVGTVVLMQVLLLNAQKSRISHLKKTRKSLTALQNRVSQDEVQQDSSSTNAMSMIFPYTASIAMEYKRSLQNESGNCFGDN